MARIIPEELPRSRALTAVEDLAAQQASGVLEVTGLPAGTIYLDHGQVTFAQATWVPGLASRLLGALTPSDGLRALLSEWDQQDPGIVPSLLRGGHVSAAALHTLLRSIVVDAFLVLTVPLGTESRVTSIRFASARTRWDDAFPRLDIASVRGEAVRRAQRFADCELAPTTLVTLRDLSARAAILTRDQWAVACQISGPTPVANLAARCGVPLADIVDRIDDLVRAGMCAPARRETRLPAARRPAPLAAPVPGAVPGPLPGRGKAVRGQQENPPSVDLLRQVLNGLRKLS